MCRITVSPRARGLATGLVVVASGCGGDASTTTGTTPTIATSVAVTPSAATIMVGDTLRLTAVTLDAQGSVVVRTIAWSVDSASVAGVSSSGLVTAVRPGGPVTITASADGKTARATLLVRQRSSTVASLTLDRATATMAALQTLALTATAKDASGNVVAGAALVWSSSDTSVLAADASGTLTARGAGTATVTVSAAGESASAAITAIAFKSIAAGYLETCAISTSGKLYCAGTREGAVARVVAPSLRFSAVFGSTGIEDVTCAITTDAALYCWGENTSGQLGVGDKVSRDVPTLVAGNLRFQSVSMAVAYTRDSIYGGKAPPGPILATTAHTCGIVQADGAYCWGDGLRGELGAGAAVSSLSPQRVTQPVVLSEVTAGHMYSCGVATTRATLCWGDNTNAQLGQGGWTQGATTTPLAAGTPVALHALTGSSGDAAGGLNGGGTTCGLSDDGSPYCWGANDQGAAGAVNADACAGGAACVWLPTAVATSTKFVSLVKSTYVTCGLDAGGTVYCWGRDVDGMFGSTISGCAFGGAVACSATPIAGPGGFVTLTSGPFTMCGIRADAGAYCWGSISYSQPGLLTSVTPVVFGVDPTATP
jgi:hypothetical protein